MSKPKVSSTTLIIGLVLTVLGVAVAKENGALSATDAKRFIGIAFGIILMLAGNMLPKLVLPLNTRRDPAKALAVERLAGKILTLAGAAYLGVWVFAPSSSAMLISSAIGLAAFALTGAAYLWLMRSDEQNSQGNKI